MAVGNSFRAFCSNITIPNRSGIGSRYQSITQRLNLDFWEQDSKTYHSFYVGSYGRGTAIRGFSDLDMIFLLPSEYYNRYNNHRYNGQSAMLQDVRRSLQKTYPFTNIGADGQVVKILFTDGITFEIVPAFQRPDQSYMFPDSNAGGRWKITNPKAEIAAVAFTDKECNGNLKALCRMARCWRDKWNAPMGGLLIDTLACRFIQTWQYRDKSFVYYDCMSRDFFGYLAKEPQIEYWQAIGSRQHIQSRGVFQHKARRCYNLAIEAIDYQSSGHGYLSRTKWREIFGTNYPY